MYFAAAPATCRAFNARSPGDARCSPEPTSGSVYNRFMLREGELDFALTQSDWQRAAYEGNGPVAADGPAAWLRSVGSLHSEPIAIVARDDPALRSTAGLAGRSVDIGPVSSGRNSVVRAMLGRMKLEESFFGKLATFDPRRADEGVCAGRLDAAIFVVGHPGRIVADAVERCGAGLPPFAGPLARRVAEEYPGYSWVDIPADVYAGQSEPVPRLAVFATMVTRADVDPRLVERFAAALLEAKGSHAEAVPQLAEMDLTDPSATGLVAPRHEGVERLSRR